MNSRIAHVALVVKDYDEAIEFYIEKLNFELLEDSRIDDHKRWVIIAPPGAKECCLLLAKAADERQLASVGNQAGGRVFLFLFTDNFKRDYNALLNKGINFVRPPKDEPYGTVAVFEDLYGNMWDLLEPTDNNRGVIKYRENLTKRMYNIHIHYPCHESYMDPDICHTIKIPFVPRLGDDINIDNGVYKHLEKKVENDEALRRKYKRWIYGGGQCSFDDAMTVIEVLYRNSTGEIHIELGESINEKNSHEY